MKIKTKKMPYEKVVALPREEHEKPKKPSRFFRNLLKTLSASELKKVGFTYNENGMEKLGKKEPCLVLMNHSSFIDLKIAETVMYPRPMNIVCTSDGFVGKNGLMRSMGCIPTNKFVTDARLVRDMVYAINKLGCSVLMYPEASYTFDGTATPLPDSLGKCLKLLKAPVVMIKTYGAFSRDPLYNGLQLRDVKVSADVAYLLSPQEIKEKSVDELNEILKGAFTFDNFRWQQENNIKIDEPFRADFLNRVLYKCPDCSDEHHMVGKGVTLKCENCGREYTLTEYGRLEAPDGKDIRFSHIPDWYAWERDEVRKEIERGEYRLDIDVDIRMMVDTKCIYEVGGGHLTHDKDGFRLTGCDGKLDYSRKPSASYGLYADYFWYEIGDIICIGDNDTLYYCFPKNCGDVVAKTRLAAEELYKMSRK